MTHESLYSRLGGEPGIAKLLRHFYADVRQHRLIGPVFNERIQDWPAHLAKIGQFWARATGGPSRYAGPMPARHMDLGIDARHFEAWLQLWEANCRCHLPADAAGEMIALARGIGRRLLDLILAGGPVPGRLDLTAGDR